jgi:hypothetical protein
MAIKVPVRVGAAALALLLVLCDLCTSSILNLRLGWVSGGPGTPLLWITGQLGLVAGVMSLARVRIAHQAQGVDTVRLRYAARGLLVLSAAAAFSVGIAVSGLVPALSSNAGQRAPVLLLASVVAACAILTLVCAWRARSADRGLVALDDTPLAATGREALADLLATLRDGAGYVAGRAHVAVPTIDTPAQLRNAAVGLLRRCDPGEHPWRYGLLVALLAGSLVPMLDLTVLALQGKLGGSRLTDLALSAPALILFEATLVLLGFAALGSYLGLRPQHTVREPR